jgi:hypothetical protein
LGLLALDNLEEGMVLKSDVFDRSGRLLLGRDTELTVKHLRMFRTWGVAEADIVGIDDQDQAGDTSIAADVDPALLSAVEAEMHQMFRNADLSYPAMKELFRLCLLRRVRNESR